LKEKTFDEKFILKYALIYLTSSEIRLFEYLKKKTHFTLIEF